MKLIICPKIVSLTRCLTNCLGGCASLGAICKQSNVVMNVASVTSFQLFTFLSVLLSTVIAATGKDSVILVTKGVL